MGVQGAIHLEATTRALGHAQDRRHGSGDIRGSVLREAGDPSLSSLHARRIHELCGILATTYGGKGENMWADVKTGAELFERLRTLPGYGEEKAQIFVALLGKRMGVRPRGWKEAAGVFGDHEPRTVADIDSPEQLLKVRAWKKAEKAAERDKQSRPLKKAAPRK